MSDVVGHVVADAADVLVIQPEDGPTVRIERRDVTAAREVPPPPVRPASSPEKLRRMLGEHWPGVETARLGGWVLHAGHGFTRRANSTLIAGDPGVNEDDGLAQVRAWYAARGLDATLQRLGPAPAGHEDGETVTLVGDLRSMVLDAEQVDPTWTDEPTADWLAVWRGGGHHGVHERAVLTAAPGRYGVVCSDGVPVGCVRVDLDRRWAHVSCVEIAPRARRRGVGRAITVAALQAARVWEPATSFAAVECLTSNAPAIALYESLAMREHHRYHYVPLELS
ncbi:MAG: GNAT family N-acetyltransferase [Mobilicoccus sp.]|nr:GNAT family N-acetyltransferase [Mobilicoccus sp.]